MILLTSAPPAITAWFENSSGLKPALSKFCLENPPAIKAAGLQPANFLIAIALTPANRSRLIASSLHPA